MSATELNSEENIIITCHFCVVSSVFEIFYSIIKNIYDNLIAIQTENGQLHLNDVIITICTWVFCNMKISIEEKIPPTEVQSVIDMLDMMFRVFVEENLNSSYNPSEVNHQLYVRYDKNNISINEPTTFDEICKIFAEQFGELITKTAKFEYQMFEIKEYEPEYFIPADNLVIYPKYNIDSVRKVLSEMLQKSSQIDLKVSAETLDKVILEDDD